MANKVKVSGYSQKVTYDYGNIQYRNFDPDLVGLQLASGNGTTLFTMGNFNITTNLDPKLDKNYITGNYTNFISLDDLDLTLEETKSLLVNNTSTFLNLDITNLKNFALFGSMTEFVRISLENIITNWPASIYVTTLVNIDGLDYNVNTYEDYVYDSLYDFSTFSINNRCFVNKFEINYLTNGTIKDSFSASNDLRNLTVNYKSYTIFVNGEEYPVLDFTGSTNLTNDYVYFKVKGNPFTANTTTDGIFYHIKPNTTIKNTFFNGLSGLEKYLLNRDINPQYTAKFNYPIRTESGVLMYTEKTLTWPVSDGYNIDYDSDKYTTYATSLLDISTNFDINETNLMTRFLVSESISAFDTVPVHLAPEHEDTTTGQKVNKTLSIYGRSFDDFNQYINGISLARNVTYDKIDNTPDKYLKDLANVLGWELINTIIDNDLLKNYTDYSESSYSGLSIGMTPVQTELEFWRRIILNTPWVWKSKGARKSIEFLLSFMSIPRGLITFNEYIYKAKAPIDVDLFTKLLEANELDTDLSLYPIDLDGYPRPLPNNDNLYYQSNGLWFRETGGSNATIDILRGNNPHVGPYDGGSTFINQFKKLIPNFSATTIEVSSSTTSQINLFLNYKQGDITHYTGKTYIDILNEDNADISQCVVYKAEVLKDPMPTVPTNICGCPCEGEDDMLSICLEKNTSKPAQCSELAVGGKRYIDPKTGFWIVDENVYGVNGTVVTTKPTSYINKECCKVLGGQSTLYQSTWTGGIENNDPYMGSSGQICCTTKQCGCNVACNWSLLDRTLANPAIIQPIQIPSNSGNYFLRFKRLHGYGMDSVVTIDGSNCPQNYTIPVSGIVDPFTNEVGFGCRLTQLGLSNMNSGMASMLFRLIEARRIGSLFPGSRGTIGCCDQLPLNYGRG